MVNINIKKTGNLIFLIGMFAILMANWNSYSLFQKVEHYNAPVFSALLIILLICNIDIKSLIKDKIFYLIIAINIISIVNLLVLKTSLYTEIIIFDITLTLFLADKIKFAKNEILTGTAIIAIFFIYWTIDVKGYFKGYSINLGGEILITGLMFLVFLVEVMAAYLTDKLKDDNLTAKIPVIVILIETVIAIVGYKIISYYRSRTAFFVLIVFCLLLIFEKILFFANKIITEKIRRTVNLVIGIISVVGMAIAPSIYVSLGEKYRSDYTKLFFKQIFSNRFEAWPALWDVYKHFPLTGIGTMYMQDVGIYRDGLLDTYNSFLDLLVVHGPFVCAGVVALLVIVLIKQSKNCSKSYNSSFLYVITISMICLSYSENYILTVPFMGLFLFANSVINSQIEVGLCQPGVIDYIRKNKSKAIIAISVSVALAFLYLILGPIEIYYSNYDEFSFVMKDFIPQFVTVGVIASIVSMLILIAFDGKIFKALCTALFAILVASYIQYLFMNKELMDADGGLKTADEVGAFATITLVVWIVLIIAICVISIILRKNWSKMITYVSLALIAMQLMAIVSLIVSNNGRNKDFNWLSGEEQFNIASNENIIVLIPDSFCRGVLKEVLEEYPDAMDSFNDFTYYDNVDSIYNRTYMSMIHMFTGEKFDETVDRYEWTKNSFAADKPKKFFSILKDKGYKTNLYTKDILYEEFVQDYFDNVEEVKIHVIHGYLFKTLLKMSTYRYVPYVFKEPFNVSMLGIEAIYKYEGVAPCWKNSDVYKELNERGISVDESVGKGLFINHFSGTHIPLANDENANETGENEVPKVETYRGAIKVLETYIQKLKEIGKYDDSTIIIFGDHGLGDTDSVLLIKHKNEKHDSMIVDSSETTFDDFIPTIINEIGGDYKEFGERVW